MDDVKMDEWVRAKGYIPTISKNLWTKTSNNICYRLLLSQKTIVTQWQRTDGSWGLSECWIIR